MRCDHNLRVMRHWPVEAALVLMLLSGCAPAQVSRPRPDFGMACRQLKEADVLALWIRSATLAPLKKSYGRDYGLHWDLEQEQLARALEDDLQQAAENLEKAGSDQIADLVDAVHRATFDLAQVMRMLMFTDADRRVGKLRRALGAVDEAIEGAYALIGARVAPCAAFA